ncbi:hypothetical protein COCNU_15G005460 [Cocos nucifera]|uniref:Uncharacterized protein n=1 Tax=Cocos nucifera TaxID=13894 RepID=A0A8K0NDK4_COCNU|nr:hypothetical protein COCNU_15G005460 [Cocos nucifera]
MSGFGGPFWGTRALEIVKRNNSPGLLWKRIKLTTTRKANAKKRLHRVWQAFYHHDTKGSKVEDYFYNVNKFEEAWPLSSNSYDKESSTQSPISLCIIRPNNCMFL